VSGSVQGTMGEDEEHGSSSKGQQEVLHFGDECYGLSGAIPHVCADVIGCTDGLTGGYKPVSGTLDIKHEICLMRRRICWVLKHTADSTIVEGGQEAARRRRRCSAAQGQGRLRWMLTLTLVGMRH
jgi:hypothetical protein